MSIDWDAEWAADDAWVERLKAQVAEGVSTEHHYEGERCVFCGVNVYDNSLYHDDGPCKEHPPIAYSTVSEEISEITS